MSTKTTFKRVALVAVAALGLGVLSVAPSSATPSMTVTATNGSGTLVGGNAVAALETTTAARISVSGLFSASTDSVSVVVLRKSGPAASSSVSFRLGLVDTSTGLSTGVRRTKDGATLTSLANGANRVSLYDSSTAFNTGVSEAYILDGGQAFQGVNLNLIPETSTTRVAGTYVFTAIVTSFTTTGASVTNTVQTVDVSYVISNSAAGSAALATAAALISGTVDPSKTTAILNAGAPTTFSAVDSAVAVVATAAATNHASIQVKTFTADSDPTPESVTATVTGAGVICNSDGSVCGKSLTITGAGGDNTLRVRADGTAGTGSIVIKTTTLTFPAKSVTFYAKAAKTITATANQPVIGVTSATDVIRATAVDAEGNIWGGAASSMQQQPLMP
jgi:trimeric autotransporter adhesin